MDKINYNLKRHIELLKRQEDLRNQNKTLLKTNQQEFSELTKYNVAVSNHIFWEDRYQVASLMQAFLNKEMNAHEFHDAVFGLRNIQIAKFKKFRSNLLLETEELKDFYPNKKSHKLEGFLSALYWKCEGFEMQFDEEYLYTTVQNGFLNFQKALKEE
jgi:hypothetical protein